MKLIYLDKLKESSYERDVWDLLKACDSEFVPMLSAREGPLQQELSGGDTKPGGPVSYFEELQGQHFLIASLSGRLAAFMTFRTGYCPDGLKSFGDSVYVSTVCVYKEFRGQGITGKLYEELERLAVDSFGCNRISTRTWSGNDAHIAVLTKKGYRVLRTLKGDRGPGIDTIYFGKTIDVYR